MKHGKKPNVRQSIFIEEKGFNPYEYWVIKDTPTEMWIVARNADHFVITLYK
jgi:hypothetical protein